MNNAKVALIYGGLGQNGYLLSQFLIKKNYKIFCIVKKLKKSKSNKKISYIKLNLEKFDLIYKLIRKIKPREIYNFLGPSDKESFQKKPYFQFKKDYICNLNTLETIRLLKLKTKLFYCSSSEVFGSDERVVNEKSIRKIENYYSLTKNMNELLISYYRNNYKLNACYGVLFNHDSEFRKKKFLYKILYDFFKKKKFPKSLKIRNINDIKYRSNAKILIEVIWSILNKKVVDDYIISSDKPYSVEDLINNLAKLNNIDLVWSKKDGKFKIYNKKKIIIFGNIKKNKYKIKPNLTKLKNNLKINPKKLRLF